MAEQPQLHMLKSGLTNLPPLSLPRGYAVRHYRRGDEAAWSRVFADAFGREAGPWEFERIMRQDAGFCPERIWFVVYDDFPVATASAYYRPEVRRDYGMIHYVATLKAHRGRGLGLQATLAALHRMAVEQRKGAWLSTDDERIPAIVTYLKLSFVPLLTHESHRERWIRALAAIDPSLIEDLRPRLDAPLWRPEQPS